MLCDKCGKNEATYFSKTTINGVTTETHLCSNCLHSEDFGPMIGFEDEFFDPFGFLTSEFEPRKTSYYDDENDVLSQAMESIKNGAKNSKLLPKESPEIKELRSKISDALSKEDYEEAAKLKKKLDELKEKDKGKN